MKYKKYLKILELQRKKETPEILCKISPDFTTQERKILALPKIIWASSIVTVFCITIIIYLLVSFNKINDKTTGVLSNILNEVTTETQPQDKTIPVWYTPKKIKLTTLSYENTNVLNTVGFMKNSSVDFLDLSDSYNDPEHIGCNGLYLDVKKKQVICLNHIVRDTLLKDGIIKENYNVWIADFNNELNKVLLSITDGNNDKGSYYFDLTTKEYKALSQSLFGMTMGVSVSKDYSKYLILKPRIDQPSCEDVFVVDINSGEIKNLAKDANGSYAYLAYMFSSFSETAKYIYFSIREDDGSLGYDLTSKYVLYDLQTNKSYVFVGEIVNFSETDKFLIYKNEKGSFKMECETGKIFAIIEDAPLLENEYFYMTFQTGSTDFNKNLFVEDLRTNNKVQVTKTPVNAYIKSEDNKYVYYYTHKDTEIYCLDLVTKQSFTIPVDKSFLDKVISDSDNNKNAIIYYLYLNNKNELLLCYSVIIYEKNEGKPTFDPNADPNENNPVFQCQSIFNEVNSLCEMSKYYDKFIDKLSFFEGDGFAYITIGNGKQSNMYTICEDYRNGTSTIYSHSSGSVISYFNINKQKSIPKDLNLGKLKSYFTKYNIQWNPAKLDYNSFITNGKIDDNKLFKWSIEGDGIIKQLNSFYINDYKHNPMYESYDFEGLKNAFGIIENHDYVATPVLFLETLQSKYQIGFNSKDISLGCFLFIGRTKAPEDKPFIEINSRYTIISEEEYSLLCGWCEKIILELDTKYR